MENHYTHTLSQRQLLASQPLAIHFHPPFHQRRALQREITFFRVTRPRPQGGKSVGLELGGLTWEMRKISGMGLFFQGKSRRS